MVDDHRHLESLTWPQRSTSGTHTKTTLAELESVLVQITQGVPIVAANPDLTHPGAAGPAIETGAVAGLLRACRPGLAIPFIGKPAAPLFLRGLRNASPDEAIMVGDNPETDINGAKQLGIPTLLIHPDKSMGPTIRSLISEIVDTSSCQPLGAENQSRERS